MNRLENSYEIKNECNRIIKSFKLNRWYLFSEIPENVFKMLYMMICNDCRFIIDNDFENRFKKII